jgi:hypothetical protein
MIFSRHRSSNYFWSGSNAGVFISSPLNCAMAIPLGMWVTNQTQLIPGWTPWLQTGCINTFLPHHTAFSERKIQNTYTWKAARHITHTICLAAHVSACAEQIHNAIDAEERRLFDFSRRTHAHVLRMLLVRLQTLQRPLFKWATPFMQKVCSAQTGGQLSSVFRGRREEEWCHCVCVIWSGIIQFFNAVATEIVHICGELQVCTRQSACIDAEFHSLCTLCICTYL